jgi:hypothetical protein
VRRWSCRWLWPCRPLPAIPPTQQRFIAARRGASIVPMRSFLPGKARLPKGSSRSAAGPMTQPGAGSMAPVRPGLKLEGGALGRFGSVAQARPTVRGSWDLLFDAKRRLRFDRWFFRQHRRWRHASKSREIRGYVVPGAPLAILHRSRPQLGHRCVEAAHLSNRMGSDEIGQPQFLPRQFT